MAELSAEELRCRGDRRLSAAARSPAELMKVTPDPGVIEVNVHPAHIWEEFKEITTTLYEEARLSRLGTEKFMLDGRHTGTGGGNHIVLGGTTPADSPFLRRPHLLRSLIGYWKNHPSLSYLFSGMFIGPTSQAPRVDETPAMRCTNWRSPFSRSRNGQTCPLWLVDRVFRNLLIDLTGNTHRAEFCIDKLYSPDMPTGRLGLVELRGFEMPPHARDEPGAATARAGLGRAVLEAAVPRPLIHWGTRLHDRFLLPHCVECRPAESSPICAGRL